MLRRTTLLALLVLLPLPAFADRRTAERLLQATGGERGWILGVGERRARMQALDGARRSFRVRRGERFLALEEFPEGWIATGIRERKGTVGVSVVADWGRGTRRVVLPPAPSGTLRTRPTALVSDAGLAALAWLEGSDITRLAVRIAAWEDGSFADPQTVSPVARGSQSGLSAAVLEDGTWLLVWSRHDGHDDEIFWAARQPTGEWTAPARLGSGNAVPDVGPRIITRGSGALIAWSQRQSEYEVVTASFEGGHWSTPRALGAPGSLAGPFRRVRDRDYLLVRNAWPAGWTAFELDETGRAAAFASVAEESPREPVFRAQAGSGLALEWAHRREPSSLSWEAVP